MIGTTISHYKILEKLGEGGMGVVYKAEDTKLKRAVALKFLPAELTQSDELQQRFLREAQSAAALAYPNICTIHEINEADDKVFIVMEYLEGQSLDGKIESGSLDIDEAINIALRVAEGLRHAHERGIIHRDIKPANIMLTEDGQTKIMDFGLAKLTGKTRLTKTATVMGTVDYMSPEQANGDPVDHRTDIWSLGVALYQMLTGELPFRGDTAHAIIYSIVNKEPEQMAHWQPAVPASLEQAVRKMMQKDPCERYENMGALIKDLQSIRKDPTAALVSEELIGPVIARRTPFVGRENEKAELSGFLNRAKKGNGALVMLGGEPGVGKTRMTEELEAEANRHGFLTLTGHCYEMEGTLPCIPFVEIMESAARVVEPGALLTALGDAAPEAAKLLPELRQRFPDIPAPLEFPPEQERRYLFNSLRDFLERAGRVQPMLLIWEDLHWADEPTLLLLQHIAQRLHEMPVLIVGTYRDTEVNVAHTLARALEELVRQRLAHELGLKRLPETDVSAMLHARSGQHPPAPLVQAFFSETEGNPFFVEEVFKHLAEEDKLFDAEGRWRSDVEIGEEDVPRSVLLVIGRRLERVSEECRCALTAAAVIGRGFSFELLGQLVELDEDALLDVIDVAERGQLITSVSNGPEARFTFFHELIRQTLVSSLSLPRRQRFHLQVAEAMERVYADTLREHVSELAHHLYQAGTAADPQKTVHYLMMAGNRALEALAFEDALRLYGNALSLRQANEARRRAELLYRRGWALRSLGRGDETLADWREAQAIYEDLGDAEAMGSICAELSHQLFWCTRLREAFETAERGLAALGDHISAARCLLLAAASESLSFMQGTDYSAVCDLLTEALDIADELGDERLLGRILHKKSMVHLGYWQSREQVDAGLRAAELLRSAGNLYDAATALAEAQDSLFYVDRLDEAETVGAEAESLAKRTGNDHARWLLNIGDLHQGMAVTGDLDRFDKRAAANLEFGRTAGIEWIGLDYAILGRAQFWRGRWHKARENFQRGAELEIPGAPAGYCVGPLFLFTAYAGERDAALAILLEKKDLLPQAGQPNFYGAWEMLAAAIEGLAMLEEWEKAADLYPLALEAIATGNLIRVSFVGLVQTMAGIAAAAGRQWDKAEEHYETALRQAHEIPHKVEQPEVRRWYARMLIDRNAPGDREKARNLLTEAAAMYREIGMPKHLEIAEELLKKA